MAWAVRALLVGTGLATALTGAVMTCLQRHIKRLLAYSTVSHSGMMLVGVGLLTPSALAGTLQYLVGHGLVKAGLFVGAGIIIYHHASLDEEKLRGKGGGMWLTAPLFVVGGLAPAGLPPSARPRERPPSK
ncbi:hypothetical protein GMSM_34210 [Geomonas sp. Red276]